MRIVVIGAGGQLGSDLMTVLDGAIPLSHQEIEIRDLAQSLKTIKAYSPDIIINTAAYNAVDKAEDEPELAFGVNLFGTRNLASIARELGARLLHLSTDYVFDGGKGSPYSELDPPNPLNAYGLSKLAGEYFVRTSLSNYIIIRTSGLYGRTGSRAKAGNFVETMLRLAGKQEIRVVNDQILSPTYTMDLAHKIAELIECQASGIFHITNSGYCSWYEFAKKIFDFMDLKGRVIPISSLEFGARAARPKYSVLGNFNLERVGLKGLRSWEEALLDYLNERKKM